VMRTRSPRKKQTPPCAGFAVWRFTSTEAMFVTWLAIQADGTFAHQRLPVRTARCARSPSAPRFSLCDIPIALGTVQSLDTHSAIARCAL
jgi:hypothetical protein